MSHFTDNQAAFVTAKGKRPLKVGPAPVPNPGKNEVVIKVAYVAINPVDSIVSPHCPCTVYEHDSFWLTQTPIPRLKIIRLCNSPTPSHLE
jgi:hypothetical protein